MFIHSSKLSSAKNTCYSLLQELHHLMDLIENIYNIHWISFSTGSSTTVFLRIEPYEVYKLNGIAITVGPLKNALYARENVYKFKSDV